MLRKLRGWRRFATTAKLATAISCLTTLLFATGTPAQATSVVPQTVAESAREAGAIFVGRVVKKKAQWGNPAHTWMSTDYAIRVEEALLPGGEVQKGRTVILNFWGGTLEGERQEIAGLELPEVGARCVAMLRPNWRRPSLTPIVGLHQGLFLAGSDATTGKAILIDAGGAPIFRVAGGSLVRASEGQPVSETQIPIGFDEFVRTLRARLPQFRAMAPPVRARVNPHDPRRMKLYAGRAEPVARRAMQPLDRDFPVRPKTAAPLPFFTPLLPVDAGWPKPGPAATGPGGMIGGPLEVTAMNPGAPRLTRVPSWTHKPSPMEWPIVVNTFPASWLGWSPEDQLQMAKWNYYCDAFRVRAGGGTGTYGWTNGRNDLAGWLNSSSLKATYGKEWSDKELAVCFRWYNIWGTMVEADIVFNVGEPWPWTLDEEAVFRGDSVRPFRQTLLHELGHMFGGEHNFNDMSVMNYSPDPFRAYGIPYADDAENLRVQYGQANQIRTDLGVSLFYSNGYQSYADAQFPSSVVAGSKLTVSNYHLENVGTETIAAPTLYWYLSPRRNFNGNLYFLGAKTYTSLVRFQSGDPPAVELQVPDRIPAGTYYLCAYVPNDGGAENGNFSNNFGWSRFPITVLPRLLSMEFGTGPFFDSSTFTGTVTLSSPPASGAITVRLGSRNTAILTVPASVTIAAGATSATVPFTATTRRLLGPSQVTVIATYDGTTVSVPLTVSIAGDTYEHDDGPAESKFLFQGRPQQHSLHTSGDADWIVFRLDTRSVILAETSGAAGDTEMWIYSGANGTTQVGYNDDISGGDYWSRINQTLPAGDYYLRVAAYRNEAPIPAYQLSLTAVPLYQVNGQVTLNGVGLGGVTVQTMSGGVSTSTVTAPDGRYAFDTLDGGWHLLTPSLDGYAFSPINASVTLSNTASTVVQNFTAARAFRISGRVSNNSVGLQYVTMTAGTRTTLTQADGTYVFWLPDGTYPLAPSGTTYAFTPASRTVTANADQSGMDFTALPTFQLSGTIKGANGAGLRGVRVTAGSKVGITDVFGEYSITGLTPATYLVRPAKAGYAFTPATRSVAVGATTTEVNFTGLVAYSISGRVLFNGAGLAGATVRAGLISTTTATDGSYSLTGQLAGNYTVIALKEGYVFTPPSRAVTLTANVIGCDFTAQTGYQISGRITSSGVALGGVRVTAGGKAVNTAADGSYSLGWLPAGTYTVVPFRTGYRFTPTSTVVTLNANRTGVNFVGAPG